MDKPDKKPSDRQGSPEPEEPDQSAANENQETADTKPAGSSPPADPNPAATGAANLPAVVAQEPADPPDPPSPPEPEPEPATHPEYYSKILIADGPRLDFQRSRGSPLPPLAYRTLRKQIEDVSRLVRLLFQDDLCKQRKFFLQLHVTADSGLRGTNCSPEIGLENLQDVKDSIADEFPSVRGTIWLWNLALLIAAIVGCGLASAILHSKTGVWYPAAVDGSIWPALELALFLIPLGVMVGLFVEFIFRVSDDIPYDQLRAINPGRWKPFQRAFNTLVVAYIFAGILAIGAFQVGVANVLLNDFIDKKPVLSLAIGFVTGFAFPYVRDLVQQFRPLRRDAPT